MRIGEVEANLERLNEGFGLPYVAELISWKLVGAEHSHLEDADMNFYEKEFVPLRGELERVGVGSKLPEAPTAKGALNELLVRVRLHPAPVGK